MIKKIFITIIALALLIFIPAALSFSQEEAIVPASSDSFITPEDLIRMNQSLKKLIDENQRLLAQNEELQEQFLALRDQKANQDKRVHTLVVEKESILKALKEVAIAKISYAQENVNLKKELESSKKIIDENLEAQADPASSTSASSMVQLFSELMEENEMIRRRSAKTHSSLGNLFLEEGRRADAAEEFAQAASLVPDDAAAHYNLALICDEHLHDAKTALIHYKKYLELAPDAADAAAVKQKIRNLEYAENNHIDANVSVKNGGRDETQK